MKAVFVVFASVILMSEALFFEPVTLSISAGAAAGLLGLKLAAIKGLAVGSYLGSRSRSRGGYRRYRYGRSADDDIEEIILKTSISDSEDCAKKLVCLVNAKPFEALAIEEKSVYALFGKNPAGIDLSSDSVEFDLAALMGRKSGVNQCQKIYQRCQYTLSQLLEAFRQPNTIGHN